MRLIADISLWVNLEEYYWLIFSGILELTAAIQIDAVSVAENHLTPQG